MAPRKNFRNQAKKEVKPAAVVNKNGVKAEATVAASGGGFSGTKIFTWFMVLALLGVWSSVAVVWFDLVDYDNVIERAKEFRFNFSEVLQGKLSAYDADGDGDFDVEDAKVLLGLKERPVSVLLREAKEESAVKEPDAVPPPDDDAAVPLPPISDDFIPDDSRDEATHPYEDENNAIDTKGELVEKAQPQQTVEESKQYNDQPGSLETKETEAESVPEPEADVEPEVESVPELKENAEDQPKDKLQEKPKKKKPKLLNKFEKTIKMEIDAAEKLRKKGKVEEAVRAFETLVLQYPQSPRCRYGKALAEDGLAEKMLSNDMLQKAIGTYKEASELPNATPDLIKATLKKRAERQQFLGRMRGALATLEKLVQIFPEDVALKNDLGVAHLLIGDNKGAKRIYEEVLATAPSDGFAKVHYGFILKSENKIAESIPFLRDGLESGHPGTDDGRFYFHLGDALQRMGDDSAYKWYERGHLRGHFASVWQRSLYNVDGLKAQPWWTPKDTGYMDLVKTLERNWRIIRDEAQSVMDKTTGLFVPEEENLREKGEWGQFTLWQQGKKAGEACRSVPKTCGLLERYPEATGCKRGQIKFSVMQPGTHVWPHTGPTNCRLRMHLGLVIPKTGCKIRCTNDTRAWEEGKVLIFDDSFEHEVWQDADSYRLIFIVDVWHPELTQYQRQTLSSI
ncbi:aspartyl/asparaginyl beta-hydroxylase isoform X8 [Salmo salar]|uniref:Aspartyl/asparaginyl beta-hydroxylase isoform X8 n=1 Tax=Salmo salar TaxID=8030 RepID=A0A1S3NI83_SALSA|nr:aspartyl/asparaginyl beta-hydroxylase-like isoform X8 [Salmo salar]|eukprot:XP_014015107.1 PREDICTED: aspartyl/asparaginyl beta-hydroxylase-like isoform X6 [Salmo salar]